MENRRLVYYQRKDGSTVLLAQHVRDLLAIAAKRRRTKAIPPEEVEALLPIAKFIVKPKL